jgi:hypothetical protein
MPNLVVSISRLKDDRFYVCLHAEHSEGVLGPPSFIAKRKLDSVEAAKREAEYMFDLTERDWQPAYESGLRRPWITSIHAYARISVGPYTPPPSKEELEEMIRDTHEKTKLINQEVARLSKKSRLARRSRPLSLGLRKG